MLVCKNICKSYYLGNERINALKNISLTINKGEFAAITGESGSGKSTLMNILGCLDRQSEGEYFINDKNVSRLSSRALSLVRGKQLGFVFQSFNLIPSLSALENVQLPLYYREVSLKKRRERARRALQLVGMEERMHHLPSQLSGGQQQRVAVARAIVGNPLVILADEPTGNLDQKNSMEVLLLLKKLSKEGTTVVLVTHDNAIAQSADRIIRITNGKIDESVRMCYNLYIMK